MSAIAHDADASLSQTPTLSLPLSGLRGRQLNPSALRPLPGKGRGLRRRNSGAGYPGRTDWVSDRNTSSSFASSVVMSVISSPAACAAATSAGAEARWRE